MDCDIFNFFWNNTSTCTDLTNLATMEIEIIIGVIGAIIITGAFYKRESNRKKSRGERLTKANVNKTMPLRVSVRRFLRLIENSDLTPQNLRWQFRGTGLIRESVSRPLHLLLDLRH